MRYLAAIFALLLVWAFASAVADEKRMSKMPRKAALSAKGAPISPRATPSPPQPAGAPAAPAPSPPASPPQAGAPPAPAPAQPAQPAPPPQAGAPPAPAPTVTRIPLAAADLIFADGKSVGTVVLTQTPSGVSLA